MLQNFILYYFIYYIKLLQQMILLISSVASWHLNLNYILMNIGKFWRTTALAFALAIPCATYSMKTKEHSIWSWGSGRNGELGIGAQTNSTLPKCIDGIKFIDISAGNSISAGITADGKLYTWGKNRNGLLGHQPPNLNVLLPKQIPAEIGNIVQVSCGYQHVCAVNDKGEAYIWGINLVISKFRQIGTTQTARQTLKQVKPLKIDLQNIKQVSCAGDYTTFVNNQGKVFLMGSSRTLGKDNRKAKSSTDIIQLQFDTPITRIESGHNFSLALNDEGKLYVFGSNTFGQLGTGSLNDSEKPTKIQTLREKVTDISCGNNFSGIVTEKGEVFTWGFGNDGQLGHGDKSDQFLPRKVNFDKKVKHISCGGSHTALLTQEGIMYMIGRGREGQLGRQNNDEGSSGYSLKFKKVDQLPNKSKINKVSCGANHTLILLDEL